MKIKINFRNDFAPLPLNIPFVAMLLLGRRSHRSDQLVKIIALGWQIKDNMQLWMASIQHIIQNKNFASISLDFLCKMLAITFVVDAIDKSSASC